MQNLKAIDWETVLEQLKKLATSAVTKEKVEQISPFPSPREARSHFLKVEEMTHVIQMGQRPYMESLDLYHHWHKRLQKEAVLKTLEFKDIRHFCVEVISLSEILSNFESPWISELKSSLLNAEEPLSAIDQIITYDGQIRPDASEKLYQLTREKDNLVRNIQDSLDKLVKSYQMEPILQDRYVTNREGRWVLPVKSGMQHEFKGIIHGASHSKQTVFMEPQEIVPVNNRLRQIETEIEEEIERLLTQLSGYLCSLLPQFETSHKIMLESDFVLAQAALAVKLDATPCEFSEDEISLDSLRHPVLVLNHERVIPNTVNMNSQKRILLLSGPNAGGKTVLLKSVALAAHMARCGLLICASLGSKLPFFKNIYIAVGDSQSVDENLSTFAAHLKTLNEATKAHAPDELILIDEICGSTDPEEGSALARSFIETYAHNNSFGVITSHLGALKIGWDKNSGVVNGSLEFNNEKGPTYHFFLGVPGQSLAIQTAKRVGVDKSIIDKAYEFLTPEMKQHQQSLDEAEKIKVELSALREQLKTEKESTLKLKKEYEQKIAQFDNEREQRLQQSLKSAEAKVDTMIQHAKIDDIFKKHENLNKIKSELPAIVKPKKPGEMVSQIETPEQFTKRFPPGSKVYASTLGMDAVVQGKPNNKGEVPVLSRSMRVVVPWNTLKASTTLANPTERVMKKTSNYTYTSTEQDPVLDLRGKNIEVALEELELQLDKASLHQEDRIKIIHGHGTDALKRAIRSYLSRSLYVKKWHSGSEHSGGDGVTWVEIKD